MGFHGYHLLEFFRCPLYKFSRKLHDFYPLIWMSFVSRLFGGVHGLARSCHIPFLHWRLHLHLYSSLHCVLHLWRKRVASKCKPRESLNSARPSLSYLAAWWRTLPLSKRPMVTASSLAAGGLTRASQTMSLIGPWVWHGVLLSVLLLSSLISTRFSSSLSSYTGAHATSSDARSSTAKIGNVTAKSSSTSIFLESTKVRT